MRLTWLIELLVVGGEKNRSKRGRVGALATDGVCLMMICGAIWVLAVMGV